LTKNQTTAILKRLEEGTAGIYKQYENHLAASEAKYRKKVKDLDAEYQAAANASSARARIDLANTLEKMADSGYIRSGETVQATIAANGAKNSALTSLGVENARAKEALAVEKMQEEADLSARAQKEATSLETRLLEEAGEQERWEREFLAKEKQREFDNALEKEKLLIQAGRTENEKEGITPSKSAYDYVDEIVKRYTKYDSEKKYKVVDRSGILQTLSALIKDTSLSYQYRYEMYLYAKSLGYVNK
jgi:hypothetical protein